MSYKQATQADPTLAATLREQVANLLRRHLADGNWHPANQLWCAIPDEVGQPQAAFQESHLIGSLTGAGKLQFAKERLAEEALRLLEATDGYEVRGELPSREIRCKETLRIKPHLIEKRRKLASQTKASSADQHRTRENWTPTDRGIDQREQVGTVADHSSTIRAQSAMR